MSGFRSLGRLVVGNRGKLWGLSGTGAGNCVLVASRINFYQQSRFNSTRGSSAGDGGGEGFTTSWYPVYRRAESAVFSLGFSLYRQFSGQGDKMHSEKCVMDFPSYRVIGIPALSDNYMYLVIDKSSQQAIIVDPVEPDNVISEVRRENVTLTGVLTTHHHWDHAGGNEDLVKKYAQLDASTTLAVYGGDTRIGALTNKVGQGDVIPLGQLSFQCHFTPCHTTGHICYFLPSPGEGQPPSVFTGDTLFIAGCGRFFEGTPPQMHAALVEKLGSLPPETRVFCGHEYTVNNLKFAMSLEPDNAVAKEKLDWAQNQRQQRLPTIPSTIGEEKEINPFMRCVVPDLQKKVGTTSGDAVACMGKLRQMKDSFKA